MASGHTHSSSSWLRYLLWCWSVNKDTSWRQCPPALPCCTSSEVWWTLVVVGRYHPYRVTAKTVLYWNEPQTMRFPLHGHIIMWMLYCDCHLASCMCGNRFQHHVLGYYAQPEHTMVAPSIVCAPADIPPSAISFTAWLVLPLYLLVDWVN